MIAPSIHVVSKDIDTVMGFLTLTASILYPGERILFHRLFSHEEASQACGDLANPVLQIESVPHGEDLSGYRPFRVPAKGSDLKPYFAGVRGHLLAALTAAAAVPSRVGLEFKVFTRQPGEYGIVVGLTAIKLGS